VAGGKLVVVDAIDDAAARFYRHHDFEPIEGNPSRLVMKLSTVAGAIGLAWPQAARPSSPSAATSALTSSARPVS